MEPDKKTIRIVTNHLNILKNTLEKLNALYKTDFQIQKYVNDEVNYAIIEYGIATENQVFDLGYQYGEYIMHLRLNGDIKD